MFNGTRDDKRDPVELTRHLEARSEGEIIVESIDYDRVIRGYDFKLVRRMRAPVTVPMMILGRAAHLRDSEKRLKG